jgi:hypothetical protein
MLAVELTDKDKAKMRASGRIAYGYLEEWREKNKKVAAEVSRKNGALYGGRPQLYAECKPNGRKPENIRHRFKAGRCTICNRTKDDLMAEAKE